MKTPNKKNVQLIQITLWVLLTLFFRVQTVSAFNPIETITDIARDSILPNSPFSTIDSGVTDYGDRGKQCGPDLTCFGEQTCQISFVDILPLSEDFPTIVEEGQEGIESRIRYRCMNPPFIDAPGNPRRGITRPDIIDPNTGQIIRWYNDVIPSPLYPPGFGYPVAVNGGFINANITGTTTAIPVDLFNPLPLPTNIVSPRPLPVVVVDDLATYHQSKIDEATAQLIKTQAQEEAAENVAEAVAQEKPQNYFTSLQTDSAFTAAFDPQTGIIPQIFASPFAATDIDLPGIEALTFREVGGEDGMLGITSDDWLVEFENNLAAFDANCQGVDIANAHQAENAFYCAIELSTELNSKVVGDAAQFEAMQRKIYASEANLINYDYLTRSVAYQTNPETGETTDQRGVNPFTSNVVTPGAQIEAFANEFLVKLPYDTLRTSNPCYTYSVNPVEKYIDNLFSRGLVGGMLTDNSDPEAILAGFANTLLGGLLGTLECEIQGELTGFFEDFFGGGLFEGVAEGLADDIAGAVGDGIGGLLGI